MNPIFIKSLEVVYWLLLFVMVFQISKHYILCSVSSRKTKQNLKQKKGFSKPHTIHRRIHLDQNSQTIPPLDYSVYKLPELEISISSEPEIFVPIVKKSTPKKTLEPQDKSVLSSYIDDFFSASSSAETGHQSKAVDCDINLPLDDEIITVTEPSNYRISSPANDEAFTKIEQSSVIA